MKAQRPSTIAAAVVNTERQRVPIPFGLFIALGVYGVLATGWVWATWWNAPEYQAAVHLDQAVTLLGIDDGRSCTPQQLEEAFVHLLEVGRLMPQERRIHERIEGIRWRFDERKLKLRQDLKMRAESVSLLHEKIRSSREKSFMVVSERERGWAPDQLLNGPSKAILWLIPGAVVICIVWAWWTFGPKSVRAREREVQLQQQEAEVKELGAYRERGPQPAPPKKPRPTGGAKGRR